MPLIPSLSEIGYYEYERSHGSIHGCDKDASEECDIKCIEECSDDIDCCQCSCGCFNPSECYRKYNEGE